MVGRGLGGGTDRPTRPNSSIASSLRRTAVWLWVRADVVALVVALAPIVVAMIRAIAVGWTPVGDAAYFTIRSRDVLTSNHPFLGAWSSSSRALGDDINNLGPLQLDLLAPFTKLDPYWGTAVGTGFTNCLAVAGVWLVARRLLATPPAARASGRRARPGVNGAIGAMAATLALEATIGSLQLIEARQQFAMLLPFWLLLWLTAWMTTGAWWSLAPTTVVASLLIQTHFTYAYHVAMLVVTGLVGLAFVTLHDRRRSAAAEPRGTSTGSTGHCEPDPGGPDSVASDASSHGWLPWRPLCAAVAVALVVWAQPLWDQLARTGNLRHALSEASGSAGAPGFEYGLRSVADATLMPPFWKPGTMDGFLRSPIGISATTAGVAVGLWAVALLAAAITARRTGRSAFAALAVVGLVALASAVYTTAKIPPTLASVVPANYMWNWPIGVFITTVLTGGLLVGVRSIGDGRIDRASRSWLARAGLVGCAVVACIPALDTSEGFAEYAAEDGMGRRTVGPLVAELSDSLAQLDLDGPVLIDRSRQDPLSYGNYTILAELQAHGIAFQFKPGQTDLRRFGQRRCADGSATHRIVFATGPQSREPLPGETVLAQIDAMTDGDLRSLDELNERFGDLIRDGQIEVNTGAIDALGYQHHPSLMATLETPGAPADATLSQYLASMERYGVVTIPDRLRADFERWWELGRRLDQDRAAVFLAPITDDDRRDICAS